MESIGLYDAKNKLSELVDRVEEGETIVLTRHGKQVALLTPIQQGKASTRQLIERLRKIRGGSRLGAVKIKSLRDEGRP